MSRRGRLRRPRVRRQDVHYRAHKEAARALITARLAHYNQIYELSWNRVAIRNQRKCWGSCTSLRNLNFSYKLLFLPPALADYVIVHELCHLKELNHSRAFWELVAVALPDYRERMALLRSLERGGTSVRYLTAVQDHYHAHTTVSALPTSDAVTSVR